MTECERFIKEGRFNKSFFQEEMIDEFFVDEERKKIWAVELDLLLEFDRICRIHKLKYILWAGTLLGAVRHKGFIPWDDDIDVAMLRSDYEKLLTYKDEFRYPYFLQTPHTDPEAGYTHAKIRNSNTTAFNKLWSFRKYNFGMYIDIFPFDYIHWEDIQERVDEIERISIQNSLWMKMPSPYKNERDIIRIRDCEVRTSQDVVGNYDRIQKIATMYNDIPGNEVNKVVTKVKKIKSYPTTMFSETTEILFEQFLFPIPKEWDKVCTLMYGDYMIFPPIDQRRNKHQHTIFDPDTPYLDFKIPEYEPYTEYLEYGKMNDQ